MPIAHHGQVDLFYETFGDRRPAAAAGQRAGLAVLNFRADWCERFAAAGFFTSASTTVTSGARLHFDGHPIDAAAYSLSDMAGDAVAVLDALDLERAHVLGVSMGGMIVQTLALEHPDRLLTMTSMMSSTGDRDVGNPTPEALELITAL